MTNRKSNFSPDLKIINFISLGCAKNLVDSEKLMGMIQAAGYKITFENPESKAGIVIINTCGFINDAKEESVDNILIQSELKKKGKVDKLLVMGCLSQRYKDELIKEIPEIDAVFGVNDCESILRYLGAENKSAEAHRMQTTPRHYAYLKIAEGCNRACSFCIIPSIRGRHTSLPVETLVDEARFLAANGVKELILVAQDTTYYGYDLYKKRKLALLLKELAAVQGIEWLRLHYTYPATFPEEVLKIMASEPKICPYIDIPLQHISDRILKSMKRDIGKEKTVQLIQKIRKTIPQVAIRTSFIVGYPGETLREFEELCTFVSDMRFDRVGVFKYSHEEGTPAFKLKDTVPEKEKLRRMDVLMHLQRDISEQLNRNKIDNTYKVIIDEISGGKGIARTTFDSPEIDNEVIFKADTKLKQGTFCDVKITDADAYTLFGEVL